MGKIYQLLESLDLTSEETIEIFSESTRDVKNLKVITVREQIELSTT